MIDPELSGAIPAPAGWRLTLAWYQGAGNWLYKTLPIAAFATSGRAVVPDLVLDYSGHYSSVKYSRLVAAEDGLIWHMDGYTQDQANAKARELEAANKIRAEEDRKQRDEIKKERAQAAAK